MGEVEACIFEQGLALQLGRGQEEEMGLGWGRGSQKGVQAAWGGGKEGLHRRVGARNPELQRPQGKAASRLGPVTLEPQASDVTWAFLRGQVGQSQRETLVSVMMNVGSQPWPQNILHVNID